MTTNGNQARPRRARPKRVLRFEDLPAARQKQIKALLEQVRQALYEAKQ